MFRNILVPLDGSSHAEQVLPIAVRLARVSGGTITLLRVVDLTYDTITYGIGASYIAQDVIDDEMSLARNYLDRCSKDAILEGMVVYTVVDSGNPAATIITQAAKPPVDLIIISSHGYTGMKRWLLGSVAEKVARHSLVPVLILRDQKPFYVHKSSDGSDVVRALVALDTSPRSQDALVPAAEIVTALSTPNQGELHLAQMVLSKELESTAEQVELLQTANQYLAAVAQNMRDGLIVPVDAELHPALSWSVSLTKDVAEGIVRLAEQGEEKTALESVATCDLIVLTTHGAGGLHLWPVGSTAEKVLRSTSFPVLIVRPKDLIIAERQQHHAAEVAV
jgi:nucleotide-binding universal stress UspA family protein